MRAFMRPFKRGMIMLWSGTIATIPKGWALCNGSNGTPDLRNRFVISAGDEFDPGDTGGVKEHTHDFTTNGHFHSFLAGAALASGEIYSNFLSSNTDTGTTDVMDMLPPYHALAYIMKL